MTSLHKALPPIKRCIDVTTANWTRVLPVFAARSDHVDNNGTPAQSPPTTRLLLSKRSMSLSLQLPMPVFHPECGFIRASCTCAVNTLPSLLVWSQWVVCMLNRAPWWKHWGSCMRRAGSDLNPNHLSVFIVLFAQCKVRSHVADLPISPGCLLPHFWWAAVRMDCKRKTRGTGVRAQIEGDMCPLGYQSSHTRTTSTPLSVQQTLATKNSSAMDPRVLLLRDLERDVDNSPELCSVKLFESHCRTHAQRSVTWEPIPKYRHQTRPVTYLW
jgi:hypothetical protein